MSGTARIRPTGGAASGVERPHRRRTVRALLAAVALAPLPLSAQGEASGGRSAGRMLDDATITTRIKASFVGSKEVKARDIQVETRQGVVQLSGFADSREEADKAAQIAKETPGVKSVTNSIQMQPAAGR